MASVGKIEFRDLDTELVMTTYSAVAAAPVPVTIRCKVVGHLDLPDWSTSSKGFFIPFPDDLETSYWRGWYITYAGLDYYFYQFTVIDDAETVRQFVFVEGRSTVFTTGGATLADLGTYDSDAAAAAAGVAVGGYYRASLVHDRADAYSVTSRIE